MPDSPPEPRSYASKPRTRPPASGPGPTWSATGQESPVFLARRGRRGLVARVFGGIGALVSAAALAVVVTGALAFVHVSPPVKRASSRLSAHTVQPPSAGGATPIGTDLRTFDPLSPEAPGMSREALSVHGSLNTIRRARL